MRAGLLICAVTFALGSGCASATYQIAYSKELKRQFEEATLPVPLDAVKVQCSVHSPPPLPHAPGTPPRLGDAAERCDPCLKEISCDDSHCLYRVVGGTHTSGPTLIGAPSGPFREAANFVDVLAVDAEHTRFRMDCGSAGEDEQCVRSLWTLFDPPGLVKAEAKAAEVATRETLVDEKEFVPVWTFTGAAFTALETTDKNWGFGGRAGFRRWNTLHVATSFLVEYEYMPISLTVAGTPSEISGHVLSPAVRLEGSNWTRWTSNNLGLPEASIFVVAAPVLFVNPDRHVGDAHGWRVAAGGQLTNYTGLSLNVPLVLEVGVEQLFFRDFQTLGIRFAIGIGI